jgi:dipeptidase D
MELIELFCNLAKIPSPPLGEHLLASWIEDFCAKNKLHCKKDDYGNLYISISATCGCSKPLLLSAHMDVVGDDSPVHLVLNEHYISAEGRTLGADDKVGVAQALYLATTLPEKHCGLEIVLTRDEEVGMSGIHNFETSHLKSKYALVLDTNRLGFLETSGASYTLVKLNVETFKGGHSGLDITDLTRENAPKLLADIVAFFPQGVYHANEHGQAVTSINLGGIQGGDIAVTNVINTNAHASYSIRSSDREKEEELKAFLAQIVDEFNEDYTGIALATIIFEEHLPRFEKSQDEFIPDFFKQASKKAQVHPIISTFHAGSEAHIYAHKTNADGENFTPYLMGTADIFNMHSDKECVDSMSMLKGAQLLRYMFESYVAKMCS